MNTAQAMGLDKMARDRRERRKKKAATLNFALNSKRRTNPSNPEFVYVIEDFEDFSWVSSNSNVLNTDRFVLETALADAETTTVETFENTLPVGGVEIVVTLVNAGGATFSGTVVVNGTDTNDDPLSANAVFTNATDGEGVETTGSTFKTLISIVFPARETAGDSMEIGGYIPTADATINAEVSGGSDDGPYMGLVSEVGGVGYIVNGWIDEAVVWPERKTCAIDYKVSGAAAIDTIRVYFAQGSFANTGTYEFEGPFSETWDTLYIEVDDLASGGDFDILDPIDLLGIGVVPADPVLAEYTVDIDGVRFLDAPPE